MSNEDCINVEIPYAPYKWSFDYNWIDCITDYFPIIDEPYKNIDLINIYRDYMSVIDMDERIPKYKNFGYSSAIDVVNHLYSLR